MTGGLLRGAHQLADLGKHLGHELPALAEPLREQRVRVDLYQCRQRVPDARARSATSPTEDGAIAEDPGKGCMRGLLSKTTA